MKNENMGVDDLYLAPETAQLEEAAQIAQATIEEEKFLFYLQYDANQKEYLLSILETAGAIVEDDDEEDHVLATMMNMTQLAFIKQLDCVERVKTDEGINPFLAEEAEKDQQNDEVSTVPTDDETTQSAHIVAFMADHVSASTAKTNNIATAIAEEQAQDSGVSVTSVTASVTSSCCTGPTNSSLANAKEISDESNTSGSISCPGAEQWFRFTATRTGKYTIYTTGSLIQSGLCTIMPTVICSMGRLPFSVSINVPAIKHVFVPSQGLLVAEPDDEFGSGFCDLYIELAETAPASAPIPVAATVPQFH